MPKAGRGYYDKKQKTPGIVRWVLPGWYTPASTTIVVTAGRMYYWPIMVQEETTYIRIGIYVWAGAAAGALARLGIYEWDVENGIPGRLILDAGTVANDNNMTLEQIVIAETLSRGYYFLAAVPDNTPTILSPAGTSVPPCAGCALTPNSIYHDIVQHVDGQIAQVAGGLADPAVAPTAILDTTTAMHVALREN